MFEAISNTLKSILSALDALTRTTVKTVDVLEKEVDNIHGFQDIRLEKNRQELNKLRQEVGLPPALENKDEAA